MSKQALRELQEAFRRAILAERGTMPCWAGRELETPLKCEGRIEAAHAIGRQAIRNSHALWGIDPDLKELASWDPRNALPLCTAHHRRWDSHMTPVLTVPAATLPEETVVEFILDWGLEAEAERRFLNFIRY